MKKYTTFFLSMALCSMGILSAQSLSQTQKATLAKQKTVATASVKKSKHKQNSNKSTLLWGAGAITGSAAGEFSTAFNTAGSWTATSIYDFNGMPGNAFWTRSTTGASQGAYWGSLSPISSPSAANGAAIFDSDFMDNGGTAGAFGSGSSPSAHSGELVSPAIDLTGYTDSALAVNFFGYYRNFIINEFSVSLSTDGGVTYSSPSSILNLLPDLTQGVATAVFPNATAGVVNLTDCRIKFTFDGDYYFAMIDDVSLSTADPYDLTIQKADPQGSTLASAHETFQIGNNVFSLDNQINPADLRFGANVKNLGFQNVNAADNASLNLIIQESINGNYSTVYQTSTLIDTISVLDNGTAVFDTIANHSWVKAGNFRAIYYTDIAGESNRSNDTLVQTFSITDNYLSKVDLDVQGRLFYNRQIFPGGTSFNKFEFGSYFSSPNGGSERVKADSISYVYFTPNAYNGSGSQMVNAYIYEWIDGGGTGTLDGLPDALAAGEHTLVAYGSDALSGLVAGGGYNYSSMSFIDATTFQAGYEFQDGKTYLITLNLTGTAFTSNSSIWFGASEARSYSLNMITNGTLLSATQLFLEDGSGATSGNWVGFGKDIVPSFGVHLSSTPPPLANLVISEIMYNPPEAGTDSLEYIEIYNADMVTVDLDGYTFADGVNYTFTSGDTIGAGEFLVIAVDSAAMSHVFGYSAAFEFSGGLSNSGEDIVLHDHLGRTVDSVDYDDGNPWPSGSSAGEPDAGGASLELIGLNLDNNLGANWRASLEDANYIINSKQILGSPGYFPLELTLTSTDVDCNGGSNGTASVTANGGFSPYAYNWSTGASVSAISSLAAGTYTITITDDVGTSKIDSVIISEPTALAVSVAIDSNVSCNGGTDGGATASANGGTAPYTYLWSNSATTASITGVAAGTYTAVITDNNGCTATNSATITANPIPSADAGADNNICIGSAINLGGVPTSTSTGATFAWDNSSTLNSATVANPTATPTTTTTYTVTVTSTFGCTNTDQVTITVNPLPVADAGSNQTICNGSTVVLGGAPTGPAGSTYSWSNSATLNSATLANPTASPNTNTTYTVTVTDLNGCSSADQIVIAVPSSLLPSISITNPSCFNSTDGTASITTSGGTAPYTYLWSNGTTTANTTGLTAGTYTVTVTDNNGCDSITSINITAPAAVVINTSIVDASCFGSSDGSIIVNVSGGIAPFTYNWSGVLTPNATQNNLGAGTYSVTITDANGCTDTQSNTINSPVAITTTVTQAGPNLTADQSGATYRWLDCNNGNAPISGETAQNFTATANGDYAVEITLNNCIDTSACINVTSVGIEDNKTQEIAFNLYPNPTKGNLTLSLEGTTFQNERMRIFDMTGKVVRDQLVNGNVIELDIHDLNSGIYFVEVGNQRRKVILTK